MANKTKNKKTNDIVPNNTIILELLSLYTENYINEKKSIQLAESTTKNIELVLNWFDGFVATELAKNEELSINDINQYFLSAYLNHLTLNNISKGTQKLHLTIIKGFLSYIADDDIEKFGTLKKNLTKLKLSIKVEKPEVKSFSLSEQDQLKKYLEKLDKENDFISQRNALLIKILLYTGARISEILNIKWTDLSEIDGGADGLVYAVLLKGKGNKERYTYLLYDEFQDNIEFLEKHAKHKEFLISSTQGGQWSRSMVWLTVKEQLAKAGLAKSGLHIFRHTCARNLVRQNVNLSTIKEVLGHSNISMTAEFYAKSNEDSKLKALAQNNKSSKITGK